MVFGEADFDSKNAIDTEENKYLKTKNYILDPSKLILEANLTIEKNATYHGQIKNGKRYGYGIYYWGPGGTKPIYKGYWLDNL